MSVTVNVVGQTAVSVSVAASTSVSVVASGGIGPAGFITVPGTSTQAFGTFQLQAGDGITVSTADGQFLISSYPSTSVSSLAPVQSVAGRTGSVVLQASDVTAGTFAIGRIPTIGYTALSGVPVEFVPASHTHDAAAISSGVLSVARVPTISYTALSNTPATFTPSAHTHSTTDVVAFTAAASAAAPVQSVQSRTGAVVLTRADITAAAEVHSHSTADIVGLTAAFSQIGHTHSTTNIVAFTAAASSAAPVQSVAGRTGTVTLAQLAGSGTASSTTFLRGDGAWAPAGSTDASSLTSGTVSVDRLPANPAEPTGIYHATGFTNWYWTAPSTGSVARYELQLTFDKGATWSVESTSITSTTFFRSAGWSGPDPTARVRAISANNYIGPWGYEPGDLGAEFYTLPTASGSVLGGVKVGAGLAINSGVLSATGGGGTFSGSYTNLSNVPATFAPSSHTHSTTDITGYQGLPAQAGSFGPLVTDGTNATWTSRYSIVSPVLVQGAGMSFTRDTAAGEITIAFAGGTSGLAVGSLTPLALGVAAAGSSANASREDHVHKLPTVVDITAAAASHTHDAAAIASGTIDAARLPATVSALNALTGGITIAAGANVTVSTTSSTITIAAGGGGGNGEDTALRAFFLPPAPTSVTATAGNAQAVVSWTAPTVLAQTPITDYVVQFSSNSGSTWTTAAESITITSQPANQTAASGAATFSVTATVSPSGTATYQWEKSDDAGTTFSAVAGATSATLSLTSLNNGSDNNDQYRVVVSAVGAAPVTSSAATLTVAAAAGLVVTTAGSGTGSWSGQGTLASKLIRSAVGATSWTIDPQFTVGFTGSLYITIGSRAGDFDFGPSVYLKVNGATVKTIGYSGNPQFTPTAVSAGNTIQLSTELPDNSLVTIAMWIQ